jgi:hypothetical protein
VRAIWVFLLFVPVWSSLAAGQATLPASNGSGLTEAQRREVSALSRSAVDLIDQRQFVEAAKTLDRALQIDPENATCLFNLACVHAAMRRPDAALADLGRATAAGFTDFSHIQSDPVFIDVRELKGYAELLARKGEIVHAAGRRIIGELRDMIGDKYIFDVDEKRKFVFAAHTSRAKLETLEKAIDDEDESLEELIFSHPSDEFIRIVMATPADFARIEKRPGVGGYYDDSTRMLLVKKSGAELRHEFVHALHAADQHAMGEAHPIWLSEGLATLFETPRIGDGQKAKMYPNDTWRLGAVQAAARRGGLIPLDELLAMKRDAFTAKADLAYGEAGSVLMYLYEREMLRGFYLNYTEGYEKDPTGRVAIERISGKSLKDFQAEWVGWMMGRAVVGKER